MKLQFISQGETPQQNLASIKSAYQAGCDWVQLRLKNVTEDIYIDTAKEALNICNIYNSKLIINDNPNVALTVGSHGVHLGKEDMSPKQARLLFDYDIIIGGTANTWEDIQRLAEQEVDYIGLGPFQFTATKKKLSPILGIDGYRDLIHKMKAKGIQIPIIAIGGITLKDINNIMETGVYGIAVSGLICNAVSKENVVMDIKNLLEMQSISVD